MADALSGTGVVRAPRLSAADRLALRLAFGATAGFAVALVMHWEFSFLTPMLAVQIMAALPVRPTVGQGLIIPLAIIVATAAAYTASTLFYSAPGALIVVVGLVLCWTFYGQRRGVPAIIMLLVQIAFCGVPLMSTISLDLADSFSELLRKSSIAAMVIVFMAHGLFPAPPPPPNAVPPPKPEPFSPNRAARMAISDVIVLLPLQIAFMVQGSIDNFVMLMITINILGQVESAGNKRMALVLLAGNLMGGLVAVGTEQVVFLADNFVQFILMVLLAALWFAGRMTRAGPLAPLYALAFATFILLLGMAISPLPGSSEEAFMVRVIKVGAAGLYALGALSLVVWLRRPRHDD